MDDLRAHIQTQDNFLQRIMRKVPGFSGYANREDRRQADQIQRRFMADSLTHERDRLSDVGNILMSHGGLAHIVEIDRLRNLLDRVIERIRHATQGYAGFFDAIKINEPELDRVYQFDLAMLNDIAALGEALTALGQAADSPSPELAPHVQAVEGYIKGLDQKLDNRTRIMMGVN